MAIKSDITHRIELLHNKFALKSLLDISFFKFLLNTVELNFGLALFLEIHRQIFFLFALLM